MNWDEHLEKARRMNAERDITDREHGFATPARVGPTGYLATALEAIKAGGKMEDWDSVAEGVVMLEDLLKRLQ